MARNLFLSFLGTGKKDTGYNETKYYFDNSKDHNVKTKFVQVADIILLSKLYNKDIGTIVILTTDESYSKYWAELKNEIKNISSVEPFNINIRTTPSFEDFLPYFKELVTVIKENDSLFVDITHGFRSIPIMFASAINFLKKSKNIRLEHLFYGEENGTIYDIKDFFIINDWAEAILNIDRNIDSHKMEELSALGHPSWIKNFADKKLISELNTFTRSIKENRTNEVSKNAYNIKSRLDIKKKYIDDSVELLMSDLIYKKIEPLSSNAGFMENGYFEKQIEIINLMYEHGFYMQAYSVVREFIVSVAQKKITEYMSENNLDFIKHSRKIVESFPALLAGDFEPIKYKVDENLKKVVPEHISDNLKTYVLALYATVCSNIRNAKQISKYIKNTRNDYDHCWITESKDKNYSFQDVIQFVKSLADVLFKNI
jgi:CRISPR-associated Csx2 family protein